MAASFRWAQGRGGISHAVRPPRHDEQRRKAQVLVLSAWRGAESSAARQVELNWWSGRYGVAAMHNDGSEDERLREELRKLAESV